MTKSSNTGSDRKLPVKAEPVLRIVRPGQPPSSPSTLASPDL